MCTPVKQDKTKRAKKATRKGFGLSFERQEKVGSVRWKWMLQKKKRKSIRFAKRVWISYDHGHEVQQK